LSGSPDFRDETFVVTEPLRSAEPPAIDRRTFMMRTAVVGAASAIAAASAGRSLAGRGRRFSWSALPTSSRRIFPRPAPPR
jgi:hypothetical protein